VFVPLAAITQPEEVLTSIGRAMGADLGGTDAPLEALVEQLGDDRWLLILDNLEQVLDAASDLGELLAGCPGVAILATSRTVLGLGAEREYPVPRCRSQPTRSACHCRSWNARRRWRCFWTAPAQRAPISP
jgi:predicted ATPase